MSLNQQTISSLEQISTEIKDDFVFENEPKPSAVKDTKVPAISRRPGARFNYSLPTKVEPKSAIDASEIIKNSPSSYKLFVNLINILNITSNASSGELSLAQSQANDLKFFKSLEFLYESVELLKVFNSSGLKVSVCKNDLDKIIIVGFKYTGAINSKVVDYELINPFKSSSPDFKEIKIIDSYYSSLKSIESEYELFKYVEKLHTSTGYKLIIAGHSTGGSVASLFGIESQILGWNPTIVTFGSPKIGYSTNKVNTFFKQIISLFDITSDAIDRSDSYKSILNTKKPFFINVVNAGDIVPSLPLSTEFEKLGGIRYIFKTVGPSSDSSFTPQFLSIDSEYRLESRGAKKSFTRFKKAIETKRPTLFEKLNNNGINLGSNGFEVLNFVAKGPKTSKLIDSHEFYGIKIQYDQKILSKL